MAALRSRTEAAAGAAVIWIDSDLVTTCPTASSTRTPNPRNCTVVGVPVIAPDALNVRPTGKLPNVRLHVKGATPVAASCSLYGWLTTPFGRSVGLVI